MNKDILIYEPIYKDNQKIAEPSFCPLIIKDNSFSEWRELKHLIDLYASGSHLKAEYTGLFSPKFQLKTHISGEEFIDFVKNNPGGDVYFINPFPQIKYWSYNVWMQGEIAHPGLKEATKQLLKAININIDIDCTPRQGSAKLAYSNFWVASPNFWEHYVGNVLKPIYEFLINNPNHKITHKLMTITKHTKNTTLLPFIIERLFSTYLSFTQNLNIIPFKMTDSLIINKYCNNDFERLMVKLMKDEVDDADYKLQFSKQLIDKMYVVCRLFQQHHFDYYEFRPHPHA